MGYLLGHPTGYPRHMYAHMPKYMDTHTDTYMHTPTYCLHISPQEMPAGKKKYEMPATMKVEKKGGASVSTIADRIAEARNQLKTMRATDKARRLHADIRIGKIQWL